MRVFALPRARSQSRSKRRKDQSRRRDRERHDKQMPPVGWGPGGGAGPAAEVGPRPRPRASSRCQAVGRVAVWVGPGMPMMPPPWARAPSIQSMAGLKDSSRIAQVPPLEQAPRSDERSGHAALGHAQRLSALRRRGAPPFRRLSGLDSTGQEAERQLRRAEKASRKERQRRQKEVDELEKTQLWADHPARVAQKPGRPAVL